MNLRFCVMCGEDISSMRADAEFCGEVCRQRATRIRKRLKQVSLDLIDALDMAKNITLDSEQHVLLDHIKRKMNM